MTSTNTIPSDKNLITAIEKTLQERLPHSWRFQLRFPKDSTTGVDAVGEIRSPDGSMALIAIEVKRAIDARDVPRTVAQIQMYAKTINADATLLIAPFMGARTRELLSQAGSSYADATGNLRLQIDRPATYIETTGASTNPWADDTRLKSLKGRAASRVVRALCDFKPPLKLDELAIRSGVSMVSAWRVLSLLEKESLITKSSARGAITDTDYARIIERWALDYKLTKSNHIGTFLEPRGLPSILAKLRDTSIRHSVTASLAASQLAPIAPPRLAVIYVSDAYQKVADELKFLPAEAGANLWLVEPFDSVVFERTWTSDGITYASPSQVAVDLLTSPGRGPSEAHALLEWMTEHETDWRS